MVGPEAGGAGLGAGMQALGFLGHLVQMPGTRGVLIPCVCVCVVPHCLMLVPFAAWTLLVVLCYPVDGIVGVHGLADPYVCSVLQVSLSSQ